MSTPSGAADTLYVGLIRVMVNNFKCTLLQTYFFLMVIFFINRRALFLFSIDKTYDICKKRESSLRAFGGPGDPR